MLFLSPNYLLPHVKHGLYSGFHALDSWLQLLDSGSFNSGFLILIVRGIRDFLTCIPDSTRKHLPDSGNLFPLHGARFTKQMSAKCILLFIFLFFLPFPSLPFPSLPFPSLPLSLPFFVRLSYHASKLSGALWQRGGKRKESLRLRLWNLKICIEKVD